VIHIAFVLVMISCALLVAGAILGWTPGIVAPIALVLCAVAFTIIIRDYRSRK
jgi:hypothetical protein